MARKLAVVENHLLLPQVQQSLSTLDTADEGKDAGLRRLAEVYAAAIDEALDVAIDARKLYEQAVDEVDPLEMPKRLLNALVKYSDSTAVLDQLGPKLQAALESLGASPKARAAMAPKKPGGGSKPDADAKPEPTSLERRRAAAAEREQAARSHGSTTVDPSA